ncbi:MAG: hypothetical protein AAGE59_18715 [Cyanobacteria bacterium P01_F01_bin.86]
MVVGVIQSQISATDLTLKPGQSAAKFDVEVVNSSDRQASFHIVLAATGEEGEQLPRRWYSLSPMTSSKVPPGTRSQYTVRITDTPLPGFVGLANITVRIISPELQSEERHILRLRVEPSIGTVSFEVDLPTTTFQDYPGQLVEIPARIHNHHRNPITVNIACPGIESWLTEKSPSTLRLLPKRWHNLLIVCQIPEGHTACQSQAYPFQVLVVDDEGDAATASGVLEVLPLGYFELTAEATRLYLPPTRQWLPNRKANSVQTQLLVENQSNLKNTLQLAVVPAKSSLEATNPPYQISFEPRTVELELEQTHPIKTTIQADRPWFGWVRILWIDIQARLEDTRLDLRNDTETLQVRVAPIIPFWLQLLAALVLLGAIAGIWFLQIYRQHHHQLVSTVQFNGVGDRVVSGSSDQTIRHWQVRRWGLRPFGEVIRLDKAVRISQYRPVDNNQLMVGLENGEIQIWDLLQQPDQPLQTFVNQTQQQDDLDDRVMALTTTTDAHYLFSGHGSGLVSQWYVGPDSAIRDLNPQQPTNEIFIPELAIYDIALVGPDDQALAIAGRYNKLLLWDWTSEEAQNLTTASEATNQDQPETALVPIDYPAGGQDDYITSLATVEQNPFRLATADNQGQIIIWNLDSCLNQTTPCTIIDQWQLTPDTAVRDIAFSANGCYLVSASDDGRIMLWPLTGQGRRLTKYLTGQTVKQANTRFNSVDIKLVEPQILITSGADDQWVRLHRLQVPRKTTCRNAG